VNSGPANGYGVYQHKLCEFPMCLCLNFVLIDEYAYINLYLIIQNGYTYRFCDISICQKYYTSGLCNITLNAEIEYKRNIDLFYSLNAYEMRVMGSKRIY
jgi:hypothetical protein